MNSLYIKAPDKNILERDVEKYIVNYEPTDNLATYKLITSATEVSKNKIKGKFGDGLTNHLYMDISESHPDILTNKGVLNALGVTSTGFILPLNDENNTHSTQYGLRYSNSIYEEDEEAQYSLDEMLYHLTAKINDGMVHVYVKNKKNVASTILNQNNKYEVRLEYEYTKNSYYNFGYFTPKVK